VLRLNRKSQGFVAVQAIVSLVLVAAAVSGIVQVLRTVSNVSRSSQVITSRKALVDTIRRHMADYEAARQTVGASPTLNARLQAGCSNSTHTGKLNIRTRAGDVVTDTTDRTFSREFQPCSGNNCTIRVNTTWECRNNSYSAVISFTHAANLNLPGFAQSGGTTNDRINLDAAFWANARNTWSAGSLCSETETFRGLNTNGTPICEERVVSLSQSRSQAAQACPVGQMMIGLTSTGQPVCEAVLANLGIKVCLQMSDKNCHRQVGQERCSPCFTQNANEWTTDWATDGNNWDPNCAKVTIKKCSQGESGVGANQEASDEEALLNNLANPFAFTSCSWYYISKPNQFMQCPTGTVMIGVGLEGATWSKAVDNHAGPEVDRILCCQ
jgi:hypothetical protein